MDRPTDTGEGHRQHPEGAGSEMPPEGTDDSRRGFLKTGLKGVALLPYVVPMIETVVLSEAQAQGPPSPTGNDPPPPANPPTVTSCNPDNGDPSATLNVTVSGSDFVDTPQASPTADFGSGITVNDVTFVSSSQLTVNITIAGGASSGLRNVTITNPDTQSDTLTGGFSVNAPSPPPTVTSCTPNSGSKGQTLDITVAGSDFVATPTADFSTKITVNTVTYISSTTLVVNISINNGAKNGSRDVTIINPDTQSDILTAGFSVV